MWLVIRFRVEQLVIIHMETLRIITGITSSETTHAKRVLLKTLTFEAIFNSIETSVSLRANSMDSKVFVLSSVSLLVLLHWSSSSKEMGSTLS